MQCCRAIICLLSFIFQPPSICYFYSALVLHTLHPYSHYCLCKGISESAESEAKKKRDKPCQLSTRLGAARYSALKGAVSADGDGKCSSGVDDLARHEPPLQVLALTSRCHMCRMLHMVSSLYLKGRSWSLLR